MGAQSGMLSLPTSGKVAGQYCHADANN